MPTVRAECYDCGKKQNWVRMESELLIPKPKLFADSEGRCGWEWIYTCRKGTQCFEAHHPRTSTRDQEGQPSDHRSYLQGVREVSEATDSLPVL